MRTGRYEHVALLQSATGAVLDSKRGRVETFSQWGTWRVSVTDVARVRDEKDNSVLHVLEGLWRQDIWDRFFGTGRTVRIVVKGMTLKVLNLENPDGRKRLMKAHTAKVIES